MNVEIKKANTNNSDVIDFLVEESSNLYYKLHPEYLKIWDRSHHDYLLKISKDEFLKIMTIHPTIYAAYLDEVVIGSGFIDNTGYLNSLFVKEEYRNQLIGTRLLEKLIHDCSDFDIIRVDANVEAISLYKRFSFRETGERKTINSVAMVLERRKIIF